MTLGPQNACIQDVATCWNNFCLKSIWGWIPVINIALEFIVEVQKSVLEITPSNWPFSILALSLDKTAQISYKNSTKNKYINLTVRLIISQEQSWPSGLLQYLTSHEWAQWGFVNHFFRTKFTACWSNIVLSRCFYWTLSKTISSIVHIKHSLSFVWVAVHETICVCVCVFDCVWRLWQVPPECLYTQ